MLPNHRRTIVRGVAFACIALVAVLSVFLTFGARAKDKAGATVSASGKWTCSMCPQFILPEPGKCPKCFMDLIPLEAGAGGGSRLELYLSPQAAELAGVSAELVEPFAPQSGYSQFWNTGGKPLLAVPASAVLTSLGRSFVFVESMDEDHLIYTLREITSPGRDGDKIVVASGLDEGDLIAATGVFRIDSAMQILGKVSLTNLPDGDLSAADTVDLPPYQPAERSAVDIRPQLPGLDEWFTQYEQVRAALAKDENAASAQSSRALGRLLAQVPAPLDADLKDIVSRLATASTSLAAAGDLSSRRTAFETVSADMVLLARRYGSPGAGLNLVFCPMAFGGSGAYWLQPGDTVDNPYHGLEMPLCGWLIEPITPFDSGAAAGLADDQE